MIRNRVFTLDGDPQNQISDADPNPRLGVKRGAAREVLPCRICDLQHCSARREAYRGSA